MKRAQSYFNSGVEQDHFDLLPLINILMCALGLLLLVALSVVALRLGEAPEIWTPCGGRVSDSSISEAQKAACGPGSATKIPMLIEFDGALIFAHIEGGRVCTTLPAEAGSVDSCPTTAKSVPTDHLISYLSQHSQTHYALIAIRPSGFGAFYRLRELFVKNNIDIGYEPIGQAKSVSLGGGADQ